MSRDVRRCLFGALAAVALASPAVTARADDDSAAEDDVRVEGTVRSGWRFLTGRGRGRFLQDVNLDDGPRIFDLDARLEDLRDDPLFDEIELHANDIGERSTGASLVARKGNELRLDAGYLRDLFSFGADGDPFPRDTTRERWHARARLAPWRGVTLRAGWERSRRHGTAYAQQRTDLRELPAPAGVDREIVATVRPFDDRFDTFSVGVDAAPGPWRAGVTASHRRGLVDDERRYRIPASRRGPDPVSEDFRRRVRSDATTVVGKLGRTFLDGAAEATLFVSQTWMPVDSDLRSDARGVDNAFEGGGPRGAFVSTTSGDNDVDRRASAWELDAAWQVTQTLELLAETGQEDLVDDARLEAVERRRYERADVADATITTRREGRTTNRIDRASIEALWEAHDDVRLRGGYEWFEQSTKAPFETQADALVGSTYSSHVERWIAGIDADPSPDLSASVVARMARDDAPPATPSFGRSDEVSARLRWRAEPRLTVTATHRHRGLRHDDELDSVTRSDATALRATWSDGPLVVQAGATRQVLHTESDTRFFILDGFVFRQIADEVTYDTRDTVLDLFASYDLTDRLSVSTDGHHVRSTGDTDLAAWEAALTLACELSDTVTLGATGRAWRYDERDHRIDDYDAEALEVWMELRF